MRKLLLCAVFLLSMTCLKAQYEGMEYYREKDPAVQAKLERWQDLKFGFFIHWGPYSQKGYCESWTICSEDVDWISRDTSISYDEYYRNYVGLKKTFNPAKGAKISLLGYKGNLNYKRVGNGVLVTLTASFVKNPPYEHAWSLCIDKIE